MTVTEVRGARDQRKTAVGAGNPGARAGAGNPEGPGGCQHSGGGPGRESRLSPDSGRAERSRDS